MSRETFTPGGKLPDPTRWTEPPPPPQHSESAAPTGHPPAGPGVETAGQAGANGGGGVRTTRPVNMRPKTTEELAASPALSAAQMERLAGLRAPADKIRTRLAAVLEANAARCLDDDGDRSAVLAALMEAI
jgi:hypothetical protein